MTYEREQGFIGDAIAQQSVLNSVQSMSMTDRLCAKREMLESQLALVNEAIEALDGNEEIARAVDAITRLGHF